MYEEVIMNNGRRKIGYIYRHKSRLLFLRK